MDPSSDSVSRKILILNTGGKQTKTIMKRISLFGAMLALAVYPAMAANWQVLDTDSVHSIHYIDAATLERDGNVVTFWVKIDASKDKTRHFRAAKVRQSIDCSRKTLTFISQTLYAGDGHILHSQTTLPDLRLAEPIIPESIGEATFEYVCKG